MKAKVFSTLLAAALALMLVNSASSQSNPTVNSTDNSTVNVTVASKVAVDISPSDLSYGTNGQRIDPGTNVLESDGSIVGTPVGVMEIENIGSENITHVWLNATAPDTRPFGSGLESAYDAGNFLEVKRTGERYSGASVDNNFRYINRKEFNVSEDLSYVFTPNDGGDWKYGRFRIGEQEFFWAANSSSGACKTGTDQFRVGNRAHNKTDTGSSDFTDASQYTPYSPTSASGSSADVLVTDVNLSAPGFDQRDYDVLADCGNPTFTVRTSYNVNALGANDLSVGGSQAGHVLNASTEEEELQPGEYFGINTSVRVPQGVPSGSEGITGKMRVLVNAVNT